MNSTLPHRARPWASLTLAAITLLHAPSHAGRDAAPRETAARPDRVVVVSTVDVKGKTSPCGCHVPKGGFSRREAFMDSVRAACDQSLLVDAGGWAADADSLLADEATAFLAAEMAVAGSDVVGTSERELAFGLGWLRALLHRTNLPLVCANLRERSSGQLVLPPFRIVDAGGVQVGVFSLVSAQTALGPAADSLRVDEPQAAARVTIGQMRAKGATVIVLLSNLGKAESEDLVTAVDGIDLVIVGHNVPVLQKGRLLKQTLAVYGGEQGHYVGVSTLHLGADRRVSSSEATLVTLTPDIPEKPATLARVKAFEDRLASRRAARERESSPAPR